MESLITTFHIDWKILLAQTVNFSIVFFVLYFFALKPLKKIMGEREEKIKKGVIDANINLELVEKTKSEYTNVINKAKAEANDLFRRGKREAEARKTEIIEGAQKEVNLMIINGKKVLEVEKIRIVEEAKKEIINLTIKASEKILEDKDYISKI
ncbi:MAG: F0F1 ATP synthase subunit B [bacterium]